MSTNLTPAVSVIVPVRHGGRGLDLLLDALADQTLPRDRYEVIVVDDASTDDTVARVRARTDVIVLVSPMQGGSYAARNRGIMEAKADVIAFIDADCIPSTDWVERGLRAIEAGGDVVAGHIEMDLGDKPSASALVDYARHLDQERAVREGFGATANLWVRRDVFRRVGLFNAKLISGGDTEFGHRAQHADALLRYASEVVVTHPSRSRAPDLARKAYRLGFGAAQQRRHAESTVLRSRARIWSRPGAYKPRLKVYGGEKFAARGVRLSRPQRAAVAAVEYFFVRLPIVVGNLSGSMHEVRAARAVKRP